MSSAEKSDKKEDKDEDKVCLDLDRKKVSYAKVVKVGESTTDIRFRDPSKTAERLGFKPEDDYIAYPEKDREAIVLFRVDKVVTLDTIRDRYKKYAPKFFTPDNIKHMLTVISEGRGAMTKPRPIRPIGTKRRK